MGDTRSCQPGARIFGDWLLTLRGGLCHTLAENRISEGGSASAERRDRRILLALSWLSVEDEKHAPPDFVVARGRDDVKTRSQAIEQALRAILRDRGLSENEIESWWDDCKPSLLGQIREDAVWVNRSACFDLQNMERQGSLSREDPWDLLEPMFGSRDGYFATGRMSDEAEESEEATDSAESQREKGKDLVQKAGQWLSARFGTGQGADFEHLAKTYETIASWAEQAEPGYSGSETIKRLAEFLSAPPHPANHR